MSDPNAPKLQIPPILAEDGRLDSLVEEIRVSRDKARAHFIRGEHHMVAYTLGAIAITAARIQRLTIEYMNDAGGE